MNEEHKKPGAAAEQRSAWQRMVPPLHWHNGVAESHWKNQNRNRLRISVRQLNIFAQRVGLDAVPCTKTTGPVCRGGDEGSR